MVIELRQYTLHPGKRDILIDLFEREFVESQEAAGIKVIGTFHDLDDPDRFVWIRAFDDMTARLAALQSFYFGPVWAAHRDAANATMIDSDNVLLLRVAPDDWALPQSTRAPKGATEIPKGFVVANIDYLGSDTEIVRTTLTKAGVTAFAVGVSESTPNNFPRLPVRNEQVLVWFALFPDEASYERAGRITDAPRQEVLRLQPTPRSGLHA